MNPGFGYQVGDVFKPVGLVTSSQLSQLVSDLEFTVTETFTDKFSSWDFGEFDYIDSIYSLQDGGRTRFPLIYEGNIVSFETNKDDPLSSLIELEPLLLIFVNGVLQNPGESYIFEGGTSIIFAVPPTVDDNIDIALSPNDIRIDTFRSSGAGGQHVNTTDSAVRITHTPTGIVVTSSEKSQHQNRDIAMKALKSRLYQMELDRRNAAITEAHENKGDAGWGNQIRSYVLHPYQMVKDLRTSYETSDTKGVLDGNLDGLMAATLALDLSGKSRAEAIS